MVRSLRVGLVAIVCVALATAPVGVGATHPTSTEATALSSLQSDLDPDGVLIELTLHPDGSARFSIQYRFQLDDENRTAAFESIAEDIQSNPEPYHDRFRAVVSPAVRQAENATNREMELRNLSVTAGRRLAGDIGFITYSAEWTNFAERSDGTVRAGDAIAGIYLDQQTTLLVGWPDDYRLVDVSPTANETREQAVLWRGPKTFASTEPRVTVRPTTTGQDLPVLALTGVGIGVLAAVGTAVFLVGRRRKGTADGPVEDPSLLSNEERVLAELERDGGRLRQQELASRLEWTDPKTSRVVNTLREEGRVEVFRLGRENVVSLPEDDDAT